MVGSFFLPALVSLMQFDALLLSSYTLKIVILLSPILEEMGRRRQEGRKRKRGSSALALQETHLNTCRIVDFSKSDSKAPLAAKSVSLIFDPSAFQIANHACYLRPYSVFVMEAHLTHQSKGHRAEPGTTKTITTGPSPASLS